ncbi:hypothetical protein KBB68_04240 [Candidatus Babeliales bacterium]|nr:hypothetical protein [Candidatus Babeliales bacterium]
MKIQNYFLASMMIVSHIFCASDMSIEFVFNPDVKNYESLFKKFGCQSCAVCSGRQMVSKNLDSVCFVKNMQLYQDAFQKEFEAHEQDETDRMFIQMTFLDEVIGFMSCQVISECKVVIHQLVIDPEKYDDNLVKDFLFVILQLMPKVKEIEFACPLFSVDFIDLFQNFGFMPVDQQLSDDLFVHFELQVHPKCAMCQVMYGSDFWENEDPDAWEQDPDAEDLPVGFYNQDDRFDNNPLPESDDAESSYE